MNITHIALTCSSEDKADRFYAGLLGLQKQPPKTVAAEVSGAIFGIDSELKVINYINEKIRFEMFVDNAGISNWRRIDHVCFEVEDLETFLQECRRAGADIIQVPKDDYLITFIKDFDGNLFEVKEK